MVRLKEYTSGQFCWVDLMSQDFDQAVEFYGAVFGWTCETQDTYGGPPYGIFYLGGDQIAGLGQMSDEMKSSSIPSYWNNYIATADVDRTTERARSLGATVLMEPMQILQAGKMSIVQDPVGATFSIWQKLEHGGAQRVNEPNTWVWSELMTRHPDQAIDFYQSLFEWDFEKEAQHTQSYWTFKNKGRLNGGMMLVTDEMGDMPTAWSTYFSVENIDATLETIKSHGGFVLVAPFPTDIGQISVVSDPLQGVFDLVQLSVPADE